MSEEQAEVKQPEVKVAQMIVPINSQGALSFSNQLELAAAAKTIIKMQLAPPSLRNEGLEAVMSALIMCRQYNLPDTAMNEMAYVKGRLTCYGSLVKALAERHPEYGEMESFFITEAGDKICYENKNLKEIPWAHVRRIKKKNCSTWNEYFFSIDDAEQAGLLTKNTKPDSSWVKYTKDLLSHKTTARGFKDNYASALNGINYHEDNVESLIPRDVTEESAADKMKQALEA